MSVKFSKVWLQVFVLVWFQFVWFVFWNFTSIPGALDNGSKAWENEWVTKRKIIIIIANMWRTNEAGQRLIQFCQENTRVITNTLFQQRKRWLCTWTSPDGQHWNQTDYILCSQIWRNSIHSAKTRPGADCRSDHELLIAKFRLKLKKTGKTTRPFRYDLNQIPYAYTVEVRNIFKGLGLIECLMNYGQRFVTLSRRQGSRQSPRKRNAEKQNGCLRKPYK